MCFVTLSLWSLYLFLLCSKLLGDIFVLLQNAPSSRRPPGEGRRATAERICEQLRPVQIRRAPHQTTEPLRLQPARRAVAAPAAGHPRPSLLQKSRSGPITVGMGQNSLIMYLGSGGLPLSSEKPQSSL